MNASVASGVPAHELSSPFDTVSLCLSKGLGCPLGALIAGSAELMYLARREKHRFGGAMRQAGIVAAAGLYALDHNVDRLADDHARARQLAEAWAAAGLPIELERVQSNFVQVDVRRSRARRGRGPRAASRARRRDVADNAPRSAARRHTPRPERRRRRARDRARPTGARTSVSVSDPLDRMLAERQAERLPSVAAAVVRDGRLTWSGAVGSADYDPETPATPDTQYRIGSITKTFTATAIMQLRAEGKLDLDDRLEQHLAGVAAGSPTIRRLLCHLSGLQREVGEMFVSGHSPTEDELVSRSLELVLPPGAQHHYSNLAFALLGQVVARTSGQPYTDYVDERIIGPLGLERTTWAPHAPKAQGYLVDEYAGTVWQEPETDLAAASPAGQLWSTVEDLCRWATFLAAGARRRARRAQHRGDVVPAGHVLPRQLGARLGPRPACCTTATA